MSKPPEHVPPSPLAAGGAPIPKFALADIVTGRHVEYASFFAQTAYRGAGDGRRGRGTGMACGSRARTQGVRRARFNRACLVAFGGKAGGTAGAFSRLHDADGAIAYLLGGAPAFYLVGKDAGIKIAGRTPTPIPVLFRTIDAMPMRKQEAGAN